MLEKDFRGTATLLRPVRPTRSPRANSELLGQTLAPPSLVQAMRRVGKRETFQ